MNNLVSLAKEYWRSTSRSSVNLLENEKCEVKLNYEEGDTSSKRVFANLLCDRTLSQSMAISFSALIRDQILHGTDLGVLPEGCEAKSLLDGLIETFRNFDFPSLTMLLEKLFQRRYLVPMLFSTNSNEFQSLLNLLPSFSVQARANSSSALSLDSSGNNDALKIVLLSSDSAQYSKRLSSLVEKTFHCHTLSYIDSVNNVLFKESSLIVEYGWGFVESKNDPSSTKPVLIALILGNYLKNDLKDQNVVAKFIAEFADFVFVEKSNYCDLQKEEKVEFWNSIKSKTRFDDSPMPKFVVCDSKSRRMEDEDNGEEIELVFSETNHFLLHGADSDALTWFFYNQSEEPKKQSNTLVISQIFLNDPSVSLLVQPMKRQDLLFLNDSLYKFQESRSASMKLQVLFEEECSLRSDLLDLTLFQGSQTIKGKTARISKCITERSALAGKTFTENKLLQALVNILKIPKQMERVEKLVILDQYLEEKSSIAVSPFLAHKEKAWNILTALTDLNLELQRKNLLEVPVESDETWNKMLQKAFENRFSQKCDLDYFGPSWNEKKTPFERAKVAKVRFYQATQEVNDNQITLLHCWRELGLIYESNPKKYHELPHLAAGYMADGFPFEVLDGDSGHCMMGWTKAVLSRLREKLNSDLKVKKKLVDPKIQVEAKLFVLSILGVQSTGKSTLLNMLFGLQFRTSVGR